MMQRNDLVANKIRLLANRIRCSRCHADSSVAVFVIGENVRWKIPIIRHSYRPAFRGRSGISGRMVLQKIYQLISAEGLTRVCTRCGKSRNTGISNDFSK